MSFLSMFTSNPVGHSQAYRSRRMLNWLPLGLTYAFLYMGRYNLTVSKNALGDLMTKMDFGTIFFWGTIVYGFAFVINGPLTDKIGGRKAILWSAAGSAIMNAVMGVMIWYRLTSGEVFNLVLPFSILYAMNMYFQSFGAVAIVKVNAAWFHVRERGVFGGIFGILISLGIYFAFDWGAAIVEATKAAPAQLGLVQEGLRALVGASSATVDQTWWVFFIPSVILVVFWFFDYFIVRDEPADAGLQNINTGDATSNEDDKPIPVMELFRRMFTNPVIMTIAAIEFCSGVLRNGVMHWYPIYMKEMKVPADFFFQQNWGLLQMFTGVFAGMFCGVVSDKFFGSRRGPVAALLYGMMAVLTLIMSFFVGNVFVLGMLATGMFIGVIGVHGMLSGTATMDFGGKKAAATAVGVIDGFVYLGTALQSITLGYLTTKDWAYWPPFMVIFAVIGTVLSIKIWQAFPDAKRKGGH